MGRGLLGTKEEEEAEAEEGLGIIEELLLLVVLLPLSLLPFAMLLN